MNYEDAIKKHIILNLVPRGFHEVIFNLRLPYRLIRNYFRYNFKSTSLL